ncbi:biosynthetic peptidoglycan transglycosylase [Corticibacter populi]|uniref:biosynthetic peptidoglycan transglycosylase n=1 Tax=Corticibacter populi TaxID=1550736 RepID=UPI003BF91766
MDTRRLLQAPHRCQTDGAPPIATDGLLARAVIAAEDQRFFEHPGYDLIEWQHSLRQNQQARADGRPSRLRGASTLTQQLAKLAFTGDDRTALRKIRELLYAVEMEQSLGKARILQQYLQRVPWGEGQCGGQAAAQHYFGVDAADLNPAQAAWLAAMLHRPDYHARQWRGTGQIDLTRARWVLDQLRARPRDLTPRQRAQWQGRLEQLGRPRPQGKAG